MNVIYESADYYVVEYPDNHGYELIDKNYRRGTYFQGEVADKFGQSLKYFRAAGASAERVDAFLDDFGVLMVQPVVYH